MGIKQPKRNIIADILMLCKQSERKVDCLKQYPNTQKVKENTGFNRTIPVGANGTSRHFSCLI